jgi:hypothetical protein
MKETAMRSTLIPMLLLALAGPAFAVDGVLEINQTCAIQTGCFSGDTPGFPVTISTPGSYRLTSNLRRSIQLGGSQSAHFIEILADDVSVDLAGFLIACATVLGGSCSGSGSGSGVSAASTIEGATVKNGSITGMAGNGVTLGDLTRIRNMRITECGGYGVSMRGSSLLIHSTITRNSMSGVRTFAEASLVIDNVINDNVGFGISGSGGTSYKGNVLRGNNGVSETQVNPGSATEIGGNYCGSDTVCP